MATTTPTTSTPDLPEHLRTELLIGGEWRRASDGGTLWVVNPATEELLAQVEAATRDDVDLAVRAAREQQDGGDWRRLSGADRGVLINRLADLLQRDADLLVRLQALEGGQPLAEPAMLDVPNTIATFRHFAGWADKITGQAIPTPGFMGRPTHSYTVREPVGVVGAIIPWNAPIMIAGWKLAPALAAGCTVVLKPAEDAPLTSLHLGALTIEAGFPPGVVNVVPGAGDTGAALVEHPGVDKVSFTGSPEVGREIQRTAAATFKRTTLELGGKSPQIIFADADLDAALQGTAMGLFANQGEICAAGSRVLVHRDRYDDVVGALGEIARSTPLGDPLDPGTRMGALINERQLERVLGYIESGRREGARLVAGGERAARRGYFVQPTVFADAHAGMRIAREEIFGPVGTVMAFDDEREAVRLANGTPYGLAASIWTRDVTRAHAVAAEVRAGAVWVNAWGAIDPRLPWGGYGGSGIGRELGWSGILASTEEKVVTVVL